MERFALSDDRESLLKELIPGTESYFYFHTLHFQTVGRLDESRAHIRRWSAALGESVSLQSMQLRQMLLDYRNDPIQTRSYLEREFGLQTYAPTPQQDEAANLPSALDPATTDYQKRFQDIFNSQFCSRLEPLAIAQVGSLELNDAQRINWLSHVQRVDAPNLVEHIVRELKMPESRGFGWAPIHQLLTLEQLQLLQERIPTLVESPSYVQTRLSKIRITEFESIADESTHLKYLETLEAFSEQLPPSQNSLKAAVLYERLAADEKREVYDIERFLRYLSLPILRLYLDQPQIARIQSHPFQVSTNTDYQSIPLLKPIGDDSSLVERYLEHFFRQSAKASPEKLTALVDQFSKWIHRQYVEQTLAKTQILYGLGDVADAYAKLSPKIQKELYSRTELLLLPANKRSYSPDDVPTLLLQLKNTPEVIIKIYKINSRELLLRTNETLHTGLDVDGLVPNEERHLSFNIPSERRHEESISLKELQGRGTWIVDVLAAGKRARVLIQKGALHGIHTPSDAGNLVRIVDEKGRHIPEATAFLGSTEYKPASDGNILIPFSNETKTSQIVLSVGSLAARETFTHFSESYSLNAQFLCDPQQFLTGNLARIGVKLSLRCNGRSANLSSLEKTQLFVKFTDSEGTSTLRSLPISDQELDEANATQVVTKSILVPPRVSNISLEISGRVKCLSNSTYQNLSAQALVAGGQGDSSATFRDAYLRVHDQGTRLEIRGRNGEAIPRLPVNVEIKQSGIVDPLMVRMATDDQGAIDLGKIESLQWLKVSADGISRHFDMALNPQQWQQTIQLLSGISLSLPISKTQVPSPLLESTRFSLFECRDGKNIRDLSAEIQKETHRISIQSLQEGSYELVDHSTGDKTTLLVSNGTTTEGVISNGRWIGELTQQLPATVAELVQDDKSIGIKLSDVSNATKVIAIATPFLRNQTSHQEWKTVKAPLSSRRLDSVQNLYLEALKLDEEYQYVLDRRKSKIYPGNMLPVPSPLLQPWNIGVSQNTLDSARVGDSIPKIDNQVPAILQEDEQIAKQDISPIAGTSDFEFLRLPGQVLHNIPLDKDGSARIPLTMLDGSTHISWLIVNGDWVTKTTTLLPLNEIKTSDRRLKHLLDSKKSFTEAKSAKTISDTNPVVLGDVLSTRVQTFSSVEDVYKLYRSLLGNNPLLVKWEPLLHWNELSEEKRNELYSRLASHEVNLFLYKHDKPYFERVIKPFLQNKQPKQFIDDYLLGSDLSKYAEVWRFKMLNAAEKALLAERQESLRPIIHRDLQDQIEANPISSEFSNQAFETALSLFDTHLDEIIASGMNLDLRDQDMDGISDASQPSLELGMAMGGMGGMGNRDAFGSSAPASTNAPKEQNSSSLNGPAGLQGYGAPSYSNRPIERLAESLAREDREEQQSELSKSKLHFDAPDASDRRSQRRNRDKSKDANASSYRGYLAIEPTFKWAETNYAGVTLNAQSPNLIAPTPFWLDYAQRKRNEQPFVSENLEKAAISNTSAMMALAVLELPLRSTPPEIAVRDNQWTLQPKNTTVVFTKGLVSIEEELKSSPILLSQQIYPTDSLADKTTPLQDEALIKGKIYRLSTVVTNPTPKEWKGTLVSQLPTGSIGIAGAKPISAAELKLDPFASKEISTLFYMPSEKPDGFAFELGSAQLTSDGKLITKSEPQKLEVTSSPTNVDDSHWPNIAKWGTTEQILNYLKNNNLAKTDLTLIAWRLKDREAYTQIIAQLEQLGRFDHMLWGYSWLHDDLPRIQEYLENNDEIVKRVQPYFESEILTVDSASRLAYEHIDLSPLVLSRFHSLGNRSRILNSSLQNQYDLFVSKTSYQPGMNSEDHLAATYYLLLQNRITEAMDRFRRVQQVDDSLQMQRDYMEAYLAIYNKDTERALGIASKYKDYPHTRWNNLFSKIISEITGDSKLLSKVHLENQVDSSTETTENIQFENETERVLLGGREELQKSLSDIQSTFSMSVLDNKVKLTYRNCERLEVRYYLMDIELQFSRSPFVTKNEQHVNLIEPNERETKELEKSPTTRNLTWELPDKLKNKNLLVEIVSGGQTSSERVFANLLEVSIASQTGRIQVLDKESTAPLPESYVKVYKRSSGGHVAFYKDGYTDLHGIFDYSTVSAGELEDVEKFSILILHPTKGAIVKEIEPPQR